MLYILGMKHTTRICSKQLEVINLRNIPITQYSTEKMRSTNKRLKKTTKSNWENEEDWGWGKMMKNTLVSTTQPRECSYKFTIALSSPTIIASNIWFTTKFWEKKEEKRKLLAIQDKIWGKPWKWIEVASRWEVFQQPTAATIFRIQMIKT